MYLSQNDYIYIVSNMRLLVSYRIQWYSLDVAYVSQAILPDTIKDRPCVRAGGCADHTECSGF